MVKNEQRATNGSVCSIAAGISCRHSGLGGGGLHCAWSICRGACEDPVTDRGAFLSKQASTRHGQ